MKITDPVWDDFDPRLNCVEVTDQNRVRLYFAQLSQALGCLSRIFETTAGRSNTEFRAIDTYLRRLRRTLEILSWKHFYTGAGDELKIDTTDSGFLHFTSLIALAADLGRRASELEETASFEELKESLVRRIVDYRVMPREDQAKIARRRFLESLEPEGTVPSFLEGELIPSGEMEDLPAYFWWFATYDHQVNRPFIYLVYFVYDNPGRTLDRTEVEYVALVEAAERLARGRDSLLHFSKCLDDSLPRISPRVVKRLILGPYCSPHFTVNEEALAKVFEPVADRFPFVLRWESETLLSDRSTREGRGLFRRGKLKQIFWIPKSMDLQSRGVSHVERSVLFPHWLGQYLSGSGLFEDHRRYVFDKEARVHGVH